MADTLVIVPTYNERDGIEALVREVFANLPAAHLLVVDDNSPDGTGRLADELSAAEPRLHVLHRARKEGLGRAYVAGFRWALDRGYEYVFEMDADLSHNPEDLPRLLNTVRTTADVAIGSRFIGGVRVINWPLSRLVLSKGAAAYVRLITGLPICDPTSGYKCYRRAVLEAMDIDSIRSIGYAFQIETIHRAWLAGFRLLEVPIVFEDRRVGVSKMSGWIVGEALGVVWRLCLGNCFRRRPRRRHPQSRAAAGG